MPPEKLEKSIKSKARDLGFELFGICSAVSPPGLDRFSQWLQDGYAGEMHYLQERQQAYEHPEHVMQGVRSLILLGMNYQTGGDETRADNGFGRVAKYAWGATDYHDVIHLRLKALKQFVLRLSPAAQMRGVVDTAPLLEREFATLAGIGWQAKNTLVINKQMGSWFFLAALLTDIPLQADQPFESDHCGTCQACLEACPTDAFVEPGVLDATRCISYLTIELRSPIPKDLRPSMGDWLFGCDVCQEVCPWNNKAPITDEVSFQPVDAGGRINLTELFELTDDEFRTRFRKTPLWRPKRRGILRNAAIVLGNQRDESALPALSRGINDTEPLVRGACAWALGQIGADAAKSRLLERRSVESDKDVLHEINQAIGD